MAELTNAMKGVIQSSTARTSSTYASTDLIQLYDSNNAPTIKISKDDLMAAVKASLPSLLSDQGTSGTAFPSIASGVLGSMTAANLASVLGVPKSDDELLVDLGLPSGNLWATRNVDVTRQNGFAASPYQYECSFFSWGNTEGHNPISSSAFSYNWGTGNDGPYASTHGSTLTANAGLSDDFGRFNLGGEWRLPTTEDFAELFNSSNTKYVDASGTEISGTNKLTTINGITGICLMSRTNGKTIFFPCSGSGGGASWDGRGSYGFCWSSSLDSSTDGRGLGFGSGGVYPQYNYSRFYGFACRPVASKSYKDVYPTLSGFASALGASCSYSETINTSYQSFKVNRLPALVHIYWIYGSSTINYEHIYIVYSDGTLITLKDSGIFEIAYANEYLSVKSKESGAYGAAIFIQ